MRKLLNEKLASLFSKEKTKTYSENIGGRITPGQGEYLRRYLPSSVYNDSTPLPNDPAHREFTTDPTDSRPVNEVEQGKGPNKVLKMENTSSDSVGTLSRPERTRAPVVWSTKPPKEIGELSTASKPNKLALILAVAIMSILVIGLSLYERYTHRASEPITLTAKEIQALPKATFDWERQAQSVFAVTSDNLLQKIRNYQIVFVKGMLDIGFVTPNDQVNLSTVAENQWRRWTTRNGLQIKTCFWDTLSQCSASIPDKKIFVVLPGYWDTVKLTQLIAQDQRVIFYGPPLQIYQGKPWTWSGLTFKTSTTTGAYTSLMLRSDRPLSLGFWSGTPINVNFLHPSYQVSSSYAAEALMPRTETDPSSSWSQKLISFRANKAKAVWMDFSPNNDDHPDGESSAFKLLKSNVFTYLFDDSQTFPASQPAAKRFAGVVAVALDDYDERSAAKLVKLTKEKGLPVTWLISPEHLPRLVEPLFTAGVAFADEVMCWPGTDRAQEKLTGQGLQKQAMFVAQCEKGLQLATAPSGDTAAPAIANAPKKLAGLWLGRARADSNTYDAVLNAKWSSLISESFSGQIKPFIFLPKASTAGASFVHFPHSFSMSDIPEKPVSKATFAEQGLGAFAAELKSSIESAVTTGAPLVINLSAPEQDLSLTKQLLAHTAKEIKYAQGTILTVGYFSRWQQKLESMLLQRNVENKDGIAMRTLILNANGEMETGPAITAAPSNKSTTNTTLPLVH